MTWFDQFGTGAQTPLKKFAPLHNYDLSNCRKLVYVQFMYILCAHSVQQFVVSGMQHLVNILEYSVHL